MKKLALGALALLLAASAPAFAQGSARADSALVTPGYGTLRQDEITIRLNSGPLQIKVTPLDESVIRLLAKDTYTRLHALAESRRAQVAQQAGGAPQLFLVQLFSTDPDVPFTPEDLQLSQHGGMLRPTAVIAVTPGWGKQRLDQQKPEMAIYAFTPPVDLQQQLVVRWGMEQTDGWGAIVQALEVERAKVIARAKTGG